MRGKRRKEKKAKQGQKTNSGRAKTKVNGMQKWHVKTSGVKRGQENNSVHQWKDPQQPEHTAA